MDSEFVLLYNKQQEVQRYELLGAQNKSIQKTIPIPIQMHDERQLQLSTDENMTGKDQLGRERVFDK